VFGNLNFLEDGIFYSGGTIAVNLNALDFSPVSESLVGTAARDHSRSTTMAEVGPGAKSWPDPQPYLLRRAVNLPSGGSEIE